MRSAQKSYPDTAVKPRAISYIQGLFAHAQHLHVNGNLADAMAAYNTILKKRRNHFGSQHMLGLCNYQRGNYEMAARHLKKAALLDPQSAVVQSDLGIALKALQLRDEAMVCFDRAIALRPDFANAYYNRANLLNDRDSFAEAIRGFDQAIAIKPNHMHAWKNRGNALCALGRFSDALASYDQAIAIDPGDAVSWANRAEALRILLRIQDAVLSCDKALAIDSNLAIAWLIRANIMTDAGEDAEAMASCQRALVIDPKFPSALTKLSKLMAQRPDVKTSDSSRAP